MPLPAALLHSDGEPFWRGEGGRVAETFTDTVRKWNIPVFTSAGNSGPALSTLGAPGCLAAPITVGAYISPAMMATQVSSPTSLPSFIIALFAASSHIRSHIARSRSLSLSLTYHVPCAPCALCIPASPASLHPCILQYSMLPAEEVDATSYWFTSRGPTPDGHMPTLCAPGGAIAPVPRHTLQGKAQ